MIIDGIIWQPAAHNTWDGLPVLGGAKNIVYEQAHGAPESRLALGYSWEYYPNIRAKGQYLLSQREEVA